MKKKWSNEKEMKKKWKKKKKKWGNVKEMEQWKKGCHVTHFYHSLEVSKFLWNSSIHSKCLVLSKCLKFVKMSCVCQNVLCLSKRLVFIKTSCVCQNVLRLSKCLLFAPLSCLLLRILIITIFFSICCYCINPSWTLHLIHIYLRLNSGSYST